MINNIKITSIYQSKIFYKKFNGKFNQNKIKIKNIQIFGKNFQKLFLISNH